jgi:hypothetical protein
LFPIGPMVSEKKLEMWKVYRRQTTDDGRQVMAIVHLDLWSRWTNQVHIGHSKSALSNSVWHPLSARWYAIDVPVTPPPQMTTRAWDRRSYGFGSLDVAC